jgi:hypothetical protein
VDATTGFIVSGMTGCPVELVLYDDGQTRLIKTIIENPAPLRLKIVDNIKRGICAGRRVMLLAHHDGLVVRADGHLDQVVKDNEGHFLEIGPVQWEVLERRRHIRVPVNVSVAIRAVVEEENVVHVVDQIDGVTMDISISGAFVTSQTLPEEGSLVEFSADLNGTEIRALAVVAHLTRERNGFGLHFVEYLDNAHYLLDTFLTKAA